MARALLALAMLGSLSAWAGSAEATRVIEPRLVGVQVSLADEPGALAAQWESATLTGDWGRPKSGTDPASAGKTEHSLWYRVEFDLPLAPQDSYSWALYLPYLYDGGRFWLNGALLAAITQTTSETHVRWTRPGLITIPGTQLRVGRNVLLLHTTRSGKDVGLLLQRILIGPTNELLPLYDRRMFWALTMPQNAVVTCLVVGLFVAFVWWRRRSEVLYGLFGLAAILWAIRTYTLVVEVMPAAWWPWWRTMYYAATGGFVVVLSLFAMRFADFSRPLVERALLGYWLIGPALMLASAGRLDSTVGLIWGAGLIPVGLTVVGFTGWAAWRQRSGAAMALFAAVVLAVAAGVHDYLIASYGTFEFPAAMKTWTTHRIYLLHHAANLLLLVMVAILTLRFVQALDTTAELNLHLEDRVAERERELQARHAQVARLEREQAVAEERRRIMQDLHDGLGSQMFTALLRVERGAVEADELAQVLRDCIADMRLTFEVIAPEEADFRTTLGNFRFRWDGLLHDAGLATDWNFDGLPDAIVLAPTVALQLLRVAQEALTNVLKHAHAAGVRVVLRTDSGGLELSVEDDGCGFPANERPPDLARGLSSMLHRAHQLGASVAIDSQPGCTRVVLHLPLAGDA